MSRKLFILAALIILTGVSYLGTLWLPDDETIVKFFQSALMVGILYAVFSIGIAEFSVRRISDSKTRYSFRKSISLLLIVCVIIVWLRIWVPDPQALLVAYGIVAAGIAVALQDLIKNLAGSISIFVTGIYQVGNRVKINGVVGDVIDIGLFNTTLLETGEWIAADQATGRITNVPNAAVLNQPVQNYTKHHEYLWDEIAIVVTPESDWGEAMRLLAEIGQEHTTEFAEAADKSLTRLERYYYVEGHILDPNVYVQAADDGYRLTLRYVVNAWKRRSTQSNIWGHSIRVIDEHPHIFIAPKSIANPGYPLPRA